MNDVYDGVKELIERGWFEDIKSPNRNQLAAIAMHALIVSGSAAQNTKKGMARLAYEVADAMLEVRGE